MPQDLQPTILHVPAGVGIDEMTREELIQPGAANLSAKNVRLSTIGALTKRAGYTTQSPARFDGTTRPTGRKMFSRRKETCVVDGHTLDSYNRSFGLNQNIDRVPDIGVERFSALSFARPSNITIVDANTSIAYANGLYFILSINESVSGVLYQLNVTVIDATNRTRVKTFFNVAGNFVGASPPESRLCAFGNTVVLAWAAAASGSINAVAFNATSAATILAGPSAPSVLTNVYGAGNGWDIAGLETSFALAFVTSVSGIVVARYSSALAVITLGQPIPNLSNALYVAVDGSENDFIWVAWTKTSDANCYVTGISPANTANVTSTTTAIVSGPASTATPRTRPGIRRTSSTGGYIVSRGDMTGFAGWLNMASREFSTAAGTTTGVGTQNVLHGWTPHTQPFMLDGRVYAFAVLSSDAAAPQNMVAFDITAYTGFLRPCANPAAGLNYYNRTNNIAAQHIVQLSATKVAVLAVTRSNTVEAAIEILEIDCKATHLWKTAEHNGITYLSGGQVYGYDSVQTFESSYVAPPSIRVSDAGAGTIGAGTYSYTAIVEWPDAEGNVHWSEPAPPQTITIAASHNVDVEILGYASTWRDSLTASTGTGGSGTFTLNGRIKVFRTKNGGGEYFLVATYPLMRDFARYSTTDSSTDASIGANAKLYTALGTTGAVLSRRAPPSVVDLTEYQQMLVAITEDRRTLITTGQRVVGEGAWWSSILQAPAGDELTGCVEMDGVLFIFCRYGIFATSFQPPADTGQGGGVQFATVRRVTSEVGCSEPRSIVRTSLGIFFRSRRGMELLSRNGSVEWIGQKVQKTVSQFPIVTSATHVGRDDVVIFTLATSETNGQAVGPGVHLVFDLSSQLWASTDEVHDAAGTNAAASQSACVVYNGSEYVFAWLDATYNGYVHVEKTTGSCTDVDAYFVTSSWEPARIKVELQREHQFWQGVLLMERVAAAGLHVDVAYNFENYAVPDAKNYPEALITAHPKQVELRVTGMRSSVKFRFTDVAPAVLDSGAGLTFVGVSVDLAPHQGATQGTPRVAAEARA